MTRFMIFTVLSATVLFLSVSLFFTKQFNRNLIHAKELLILKNDSLHMLQIETKKELMNTQSYLDSVLTGSNKNYLTKKY
ncbi:hypothetical protein [Ferruginibacter sp.]